MYALFAGADPQEEGGPNGGWRDIKAIGKDVETLFAAVKKLPHEEREWWHIIDLARQMLVRSSEYAEDWQGYEKSGIVRIDPIFKETCDREKKMVMKKRGWL